MIKNMARVQVLAAERFGWAAGPSGRAGRRGVPTGLRGKAEKKRTRAEIRAFRKFTGRLGGRIASENLGQEESFPLRVGTFARGTEEGRIPAGRS